MTDPANIRRVCIESPLAGDVERNTRYADACMLHALLLGESPFLGHLLYPRVLDDTRSEDRQRGIAAHCAWLCAAHVVAAYVDYGVTDGMAKAIRLAGEMLLTVEYRTLGPDWETKYAPRPTAGAARG